MLITGNTVLQFYIFVDRYQIFKERWRLMNWFYPPSTLPKTGGFLRLNSSYYLNMEATVKNHPYIE